jgi:hypothetical protein
MKPLALAVALAVLHSTREAAAVEWSLHSPSGQVVLTVRLDERDPHPALSLAVQCAGVSVLDHSPLGIVRSDARFDNGLAFESASPITPRDEVYTLLHGKRHDVHDRHNEQMLTFRGESGARLELHLRAADDGVAFRYRFPEADPQPHTVLSEQTGFQLPPGSRVWAMPFDEPNKYNPAYESFWQDAIPAGTPSSTRAGWTFPLLFHTPGDRWGLITEAALDGTYCGGRLASEAPDALYRIRFPEPGEGNGTGSVQPVSTLPWATPWRVVVVGTTPAPIVETSLIESLNPPCAVADTSWIKPGRVSWSWLFDADSPQDASKLRAWVDLAAEMGWEYTLIDANWDIMRNGTIHDVIAHARSKGVGVMLWYNSGGSHNIVTERPRGLMDDRSIRRFEFERLAKWGVKGVKIDFFQSDKQNVIALYHEILKDAADYQIMVNFHGCTLPRGWSRTYPHLMSMEAVRGAENYQFEPRFPAYAPRHNATLPFTRNAVGPMDYTPVLFADNRNPLVTTPGHEIALPVIFESGLLHFGGGPEEYRRLPEAPKQYLRTIPVVWDDTRYLAGEPGQYVVIARRSGDDWYLSAVNGQAAPRALELPLAPLGPGAWTASLIEDGPAPRSLTSRTITIPAADKLRISLPPNGGFACTLKPGP